MKYSLRFAGADVLTAQTFHRLRKLKVKLSVQQEAQSP